MSMNAKMIFEEFDKHLMEDDQPSAYFDALMTRGAFPKLYPFDMLRKLAGTEQSPKHHPEGDVWAHTMQVTDHAAREKVRSKDARVLMWAALLHDIGKPGTTRMRRGRITAYDHDKEGGPLAARFLAACGQEGAFAAEVCALVRWHMQPLFALKSLPFFDPKTMAAQTDIDEVAILGLCDRLGRGVMTQEDIDAERRSMDVFVDKCRSVFAG